MRQGEPSAKPLILQLRRFFPARRCTRWDDRTGKEYAKSGFSLIELMAVMATSFLILIIAVPYFTNFTQNYRLIGDARGIAAQLALARMRAASAGAKTRLNFNLTANTYQIEVWSSSAGAYQVEGAVQTLSQNITFGYGSIALAAGQQSTIGQTSPIYFNSRGICTDSSGSPTPNSAIYIGNTKGAYAAVSASVAGQPAAYAYDNTAWAPL
jgi:Tfp pilus assembly protein FimT